VTAPPDPAAGSLAQVRPSDAERDQALAKLSEGFVAGRLTHETFTQRVEEALRATASADLWRLVADLPGKRRLAAAVRQQWRRTVKATDRWLRGWPPALALPSGSQRRFTIGRELTCDVSIGDLTVSRWHADLSRGPAGWRLADLGSTNGTRLNGWRITGPVHVHPGDLVSFGMATFVLGQAARAC
jgi:Domain of unknown function (DUF1707)/FHA domain